MCMTIEEIKNNITLSCKFSRDEIIITDFNDNYKFFQKIVRY